MRERILTVDQVARILQLHPFTVLKYIKQGKIKGSKLGRMYRIRESDVETFLNQQLTTVSPPPASAPPAPTVPTNQPSVPQPSMNSHHNIQSPPSTAQPINNSDSGLNP